LNDLIICRPAPPIVMSVVTPSRSRGRVDAAHLTFEGRDIAFAETPLAAFFESRQDTPPRELVDGIRTQIEQERNFARIQEYVVFIS